MREGQTEPVRKGSRRRRLGLSPREVTKGSRSSSSWSPIVVILIILIPTPSSSSSPKRRFRRAPPRRSNQRRDPPASRPFSSRPRRGPCDRHLDRHVRGGRALSHNTKFQGHDQLDRHHPRHQSVDLCLGADVAQQIWLVTAVVTWPGMAGATPVVQTTEIAPPRPERSSNSQERWPLASSALIGPLSGRRRNRNDDRPVTGSGTPPTPPDGTFTTETATTASTSTSVSNGCIVFQNLDAYSDAEGSYDYTLSFAGNAGLVAGDEKAVSNPAAPSR